jgi:hypothetical protein
MGFLSLYTILSHPAQVVMSMVTGQKDPHEMAELYFRTFYFRDADRTETLDRLMYFSCHDIA